MENFGEINFNAKSDKEFNEIEMPACQPPVNLLNEDHATNTAHNEAVVNRFTATEKKIVITKKVKKRKRTEAIDFPKISVQLLVDENDDNASDIVSKKK